MTTRTLLSLALCLAASCVRAQDFAMENNGLRLILSSGGNVRLFVDGIPFIRESHLYIVQPGWTGMLMNQDQVPGKTSTFEEGGVKIGLASYESERAWSRHRYELHPDRTYRVTVTYGVKGDRPAEVEYSAGYLNANVLRGAAFSAETVEGRREGVVAMAPHSADQVESLVTPLIRSMHLDTRLGSIEVTVKGSSEHNSAFRLFDARGGRQDWATLNPVFWLGMGAPAVPMGREETVTVTMRLPGRAAREAAPDKVLPAPIRRAASRVPYVPEFPLIPRPKEARYTDAHAPINDKARIVIPDKPCEEEKAAARELQAELRHFWGVAVAIRRASAEIAAKERGGARIVLRRDGEASTRPLATLYPPAPSRPEGYGLRVDSGGALVNGRGGRGVYYGAQTLKQLVRLDASGGIFLKGAHVRDWPSLEMRGVHWFGGPESVPFHTRMISRIVAPLKMNTMLFQADFTRWDSQPNLWGDARMMGKDDVRRTLRRARAHFLEPIPLVQGLGHSDWMFANRQNRHLACDPEKVYSFNPFLPESYEKQFAVWDEAIALFQPIRYFHIGHDEITTGGGFPPKGATQTNTEIIVEDIQKCHAWLKERGLTTMMWGDELLHWPDEASDAGNATLADAKARRTALPKDIIITDWHYAGDTDRFPSVKILHDAGFPPVVGVPWFQWPNISNFARVLERDGARGLIQSTWAGYTMSEKVVESASFHQFVAYLVAAEHAWNAGSNRTEDLGFHPDEAFRHLWSRGPVDRTTYSGRLLNTGASSNVPMWSWLAGAGSKPPAGGDPRGTYRAQGVSLSVGAPVLLDGALNSDGVWPRSITIPMSSARAMEIHWLWGASTRAEAGLPIADLVVVYEDDEAVHLSLRYATEIYAFDDTRGGAQTVTVWSGRTSIETEAVVRSWKWVNPRPSVPIREVRLTSLGTEAAPVLLGATIIEPR